MKLVPKVFKITSGGSDFLGATLQNLLSYIYINPDRVSSL